MHSLRVKTAAITIGAILASLLAFGLVSFFTVGKETTSSSAEQMHLMSENTRQSLDGYLKDIESSIKSASRFATSSLDGLELVECGAHLPAEQRTPEQTRRLDAHLHQNTARLQEVFGDVATYTSGAVTYYYCIATDISTTEHGFFYSRMGKVGFERREDLDARDLDPNDLEHTTWYYTPIERGTPMWVGPYKAHYLDEVLTVSYLTPIYKAGVLIGVLGMDILFDTMVDQIDDISVYQSGYACLLDEDGRVLHHPAYGYAEEPAMSKAVQDAGGFHRQDSGNEVIQYQHDGKAWQLSFSTLANGMKLVMTAPVSEVAASWQRLVQTVPIMALVVIAVFIPLSLLAMRAVIMPLQQLTDAARQLAQGNYEVELSASGGNDEVGQLVDAFHRLIDHLNVYTSNLDSHMYQDNLTKARNEAAYRITIARLHDRIAGDTAEEELRIALVVFHCTRIKEINETYGHDRGDAHLQGTAQFLFNMFDDESTIFRLSGDEFAVLLGGRDYANRSELMLDLDIMQGVHNRTATEPWLSIEVSKGMATYHPNKDKSIDAVLQRARERMVADERRHRQQG